MPINTAAGELVLAMLPRAWGMPWGANGLEVRVHSSVCAELEGLLQLEIC